MSPVKSIPDDYPRVTSYLAIDGASAAIAFYGHVFGMRERMRIDRPDGKVSHAELELGDSLIMLSDEVPEFDIRGPRFIGGTPVFHYVYVDDVDAVFDRAIEAGARVLRTLSDRFYGDRTGEFEDPFGHRWYVATHIEDVPAEELARRSAEASDAA
jgi:PhnB protein